MYHTTRKSTAKAPAWRDLANPSQQGEAARPDSANFYSSTYPVEEQNMSEARRDE